jgi:DNA polymerase-3 subunit delta'
MALDVAKAANCLSPDPDGSPCQECISCHKIDSFNHPDVTLIAPSGKGAVIPIDTIRELRERLNFKPYEGKTKVTIISFAENLSQDSGGALLKTLEEPSENNLIILTTVSSSMVMGTLVSRCVELKLPPLPRRIVLKAVKESSMLPENVPELIAGIACGAMGRAMDMDIERAIWIWRALERIFGASSTTKRLIRAKEFTKEFLSIMEEAKVERAQDDEELWENELLNLFLVELRLWFRDAAVLKATREPKLLEGPTRTAAMERYIKKLHLSDLKTYEGAISRLKDSISRYIRADLALESFWISVL